MKITYKICCVLLIVVMILCGCEKHEHNYIAETITEADCSTEGKITYICECGNSYDEILTATANHQWNEGIISTETSCATDGIITYTCGVCGITKEENIPATGEHEWSEAETTKEATCAEEGILIYTCAICNETKTETIPVLKEHIWDNGAIAKEPTCAEKGELTYTCTICKVAKTEEIAATDIHTWDSGSVTKTATCSVNGEQKYTCTVCQKTKIETIAATGIHKWDKGVVSQTATCATYGNTIFTCTICGAYKNEKISKTNDHSWDSGRITTKASCSKEGVVSYSCLLCGLRKSESLPATGEHTWNKYVSVEPTYTTEGVLTYECTQCENSYTETINTYNFRPELFGDPHHIKNSNNPDNYVEFEIIDNVLKISGKIIFNDLEKLWFRCGDARNENEYSKIISVTSGQKFSVELSLRHITKETFVTIYTYQKNGDGHFWGYTWKDVVIVPEKNGFRFVHSMVIDHNIDVMKHWVDPADCLSDNISEQLQKLSDTIVGKETDEYRKLYLLNKWVAENIYYDYDYYYGRSKEIYYSADEVYQYRRSVCAGYAKILKTLIQAQGIPCMEVSTFSAGASTIGYFDSSNYLTTKSNHAHVEAYLASEDRWVIMDPTWDSGNKYENGIFIDGAFSGRYFDMSLDFFSYSHKILERHN